MISFWWRIKQTTERKRKKQCGLIVFFFVCECVNSMKIKTNFDSMVLMGFFSLVLCCTISITEMTTEFNEKSERLMYVLRVEVIPSVYHKCTIATYAATVTAAVSKGIFPLWLQHTIESLSGDKCVILSFRFVNMNVDTFQCTQNNHERLCFGMFSSHFLPHHNLSIYLLFSAQKTGIIHTHIYIYLSKLLYIYSK